MWDFFRIDEKVEEQIYSGEKKEGVMVYRYEFKGSDLWNIYARRGNLYQSVLDDTLYLSATPLDPDDYWILSGEGLVQLLAKTLQEPVDVVIPKLKASPARYEYYRNQSEATINLLYGSG